ncbi:4-galactosyl-N-acetylglucosaminide 3-alpha-L-fucosyltransferase 9-like [Pseudorasbora parva]|uniref:4-galactosyl-N-acetylglucosaminide 3-alpha-L-fucosyltransferase 9-like n=1 Tax=Pseudorasbora parva TaxID=51549 RepID=UPI00351E8A9A
MSTYKMMSTTSTTTRIIIIALFLLVSFTLIPMPPGFTISPINLFKSPAAKNQINNIRAETCLSVLKTQNYTCAVKMDELQMAASRKKPSTSAEKEEPDTILLIWMWPFRVNFSLEMCSSAFNIHGCRLTDDKSLFNRAHGVLFHHYNIHRDLTNMPKSPRPVFQKWIWWNMEPPSNPEAPPNALLKDLFNLTSSYRQDSDVPVPYGHISEATEEEKKYTIPKKDTLVCWVVSNYSPDLKRSQYFAELAKHINVEAYGKHFNKLISREEYLKLMLRCKFYLSFENSIHRDYMTEKVFTPLALGTVPVVLGPPRENYEQFIPSKAFIHVDDFPSPRELADHLKFLDKNEDQYKQYFRWREHFVSKDTEFGPENACRICDYIRKNKHYRVVKDLNSWYWG